MIHILPPSEWYKAQVLWRYCFQDTEEFIEHYFRRRVGTVLTDEAHRVQAIIAPTPLMVRGVTVAGCLVSGVATAPEYRGRGLMDTFLPQVNETLHVQGYVLASLYPFDYTFYKRYGWVACGEACRFNLPLHRLSSTRLAGDFTRVCDPECLCNVCDSAYAAYSGRTLRTSDAFQIRLEELALEESSVFLYTREGEPEGYLLCRLDGQAFIVEEAAFTSTIARQDALTFLQGHASTQKEARLLLPADDPLRFLLPDARGLVQLEPRNMFRLLDVLAFEGLPAGTGSVTLRVEDPYAPWNEGTWTFTGQAGRLHVSRSDHRDTPCVSIGTLTQWYLGERGMISDMTQILPLQPIWIHEMY